MSAIAPVDYGKEVQIAPVNQNSLITPAPMDLSFY